MRSWLLDVLRGLAVLGMVAFHTAFDLNLFGFVSLELYQGNWLLFQRTIVTLFILVSAASLVFSYEKRSSFKQHLNGLAILLAAALLVTAATYAVYPHYAIYFGILHFLFACRLVSLVIFSFFKKQEWHFWFLLGVLSLSLNWFFPFGNSPEGTYVGLPFGFVPASFLSFDYYPFFPWSGIFFLGVGMALFLKTLHFTALQNPKFLLFDLLELTGKNALFIYLMHEFIVLAVIFSVAVYL